MSLLDRLEGFGGKWYERELVPAFPSDGALIR